MLEKNILLLLVLYIHIYTLFNYLDPSFNLALKSAIDIYFMKH